MFRHLTRNHSTRCVEGRVMRHDPQHDDPDLETDIGQCPECEGNGCKTEERNMDRIEKRDREARERAANAHREELTEALVRVSVSLIGALSYIKATPECRKAAASDKIFDRTLKDYEKALDMARIALP